ncbi:MAG: undecaprenyl/decaprenyl-phosphate alpha-N-acetylglucosaminyl 1-phosphate transferase [Oscillospiraceae bacterium]|nr:undecaprenyl/decaprenyl-phosphate alpha-N-acetylglucosaminyl 1-phosphate transferase [Oscillospiraceae bacterium]
MDNIENLEEIIDLTFGSVSVYGFLNAVTAVIFAALMAFVTTPIVRVIAFKTGAVDDPKRDNRRMHKTPTPRLGGLAVFFSFVVSVFLFYGVSNFTLSMIAGAFLLIIVGILDDVFRDKIRAVIKLLVQIAAAGLVVWQGEVLIERVNIFGRYIHFGYFSVPLTVFWIVGIINAVNLIDGLDGLSCGIATISAVSLLLVTILLGDFRLALLIAILAGSCLGFLPFNINPAKIFIGDTGATFLGYILAVVSIQGLFKAQAVITFIIPFLILAVPIFDTTFAIIRRVITGRHPFSADRGHLHHRLIDMGFNKKQTVRILYAVSALLGVSSIMFVTHKIIYALVIIAISLGISFAMWIIFRDEKMKTESGIIPENGNGHNHNKDKGSEDGQA